MMWGGSTERASSCTACMVCVCWVRLGVSGCVRVQLHGMCVLGVSGCVWVCLGAFVFSMVCVKGVSLSLFFAMGS